MTDTTSTPHAQPSPPPIQQEAGFFRWVRGLGVVRADRWLGGVCGGLAARAGIDPLIVRGMFVVAALIGFPAVLIYAVCWVLLPDLQGRIPLQQLSRSSVGPVVVIVGSIVVALLVLISLGGWLRGDGGLWWLFGGWWWQAAGLYGFGQFLSVVLGLGLVAGVIVVIVKLSRHTTSGGAVAPLVPGSADASGTSAAPDATADTGMPVQPAVAVASSSPSPEPLVAPVAPDVPAADASADDVAHWRLRQEEWRRQYDEWRQQQAGADAAAKEQARREREEQGRAFALAAQERAAWRRRTKPRTPALYVLGVVGAALIGGAITALTVAHLGVLAACGAALLVAAIVCATGMAVAGILRRRSGFLTFVASVLLAAGLIVGYLGIVVPDGVNLSVSTASATSQSFRQAFGATTIVVVPSDLPGAPVTIDKAAGSVDVMVEPGAIVALDATLGDGHVYRQVIHSDGTTEPTRELPGVDATSTGTTYTWTNATGGTGRSSHTGTPVHVDLTHGDVFIYEQEQSK